MKNAVQAKSQSTFANTYANYAHTWWTPPEWLEWVTATLGVGWHDPCPQDYGDDSPCGLSYPWAERNYCNHPGARGSTVAWWAKFAAEIKAGKQGIWCAFSVEQIRHMTPSPFLMPGWLVMPQERVGFVWGGPDKDLGKGKIRRHGEAAKSPGNWTVFWSSMEPAETPRECLVVPTGVSVALESVPANEN